MSTKRFYQSIHFQYGLPFLIFMVGGSFFLREFKTVRYEFRKQKEVSKEEAFPELKDKLVPESELTLEAQYEKTVKSDLWGDWKNKRIPRPYDEVQEAKQSIN